MVIRICISVGISISIIFVVVDLTIIAIRIVVAAFVVVIVVVAVVKRWVYLWATPASAEPRSAMPPSGAFPMFGVLYSISDFPFPMFGFPISDFPFSIFEFRFPMFDIGVRLPGCYLKCDRRVTEHVT